MHGGPGPVSYTHLDVYKRQDLNEVLECSDRLLVMHKGKVVAAFPKANEVSEETLGEYMLGIKEMTLEEMEALL